MKVKDVLVIGAGIAGCAAALALAKRGVSVAILSPSPYQRLYRRSFIQRTMLEKKLDDLRRSVDGQEQRRATEQLSQFAQKSLEELLGGELEGEKGQGGIHCLLQNQLKKTLHVEWLSGHRAIELLTLDAHSSKHADLYKKTTCLGAYVYNEQTGKVEKILAKETILATGGASSLFLYSTSASSSLGEGFALAYQAGARLINMEHTQFYPFNLLNKNNPCLPIPLNALNEGGELSLSEREAYEVDENAQDLASDFYQALLCRQAEHGRLTFPSICPTELKEKFPLIEEYSLSKRLDPTKDYLPVVPAACYTRGGVLVDSVGQTTLHRLRAVGEVACTGLRASAGDEAKLILESLTWATACAEDLSKQLAKFIYYFPEVKEWKKKESDLSFIKEDWQLLRHIMWAYCGMNANHERLKRGYGLLQQINIHLESEEKGFSLESQRFALALQTALLMTRAALGEIKHASSFQLERPSRI